MEKFCVTCGPDAENRPGQKPVGDLLFDVLLLARIVERDFPGATVGNMLKGVAEKVRRRCPHVFAGEHCETPAEAAEIWKREKAKEKFVYCIHLYVLIQSINKYTKKFVSVSVIVISFGSTREFKIWLLGRKGPPA